MYWLLKAVNLRFLEQGEAIRKKCIIFVETKVNNELR